MREHRLTDEQRAISERALAQESAKRRHVVIHISGAHAYGFPSPDSDVDLKAIHIEHTRALLGLDAPAPAANRLEVIDGVEIDYTSNELGQAVRGLLKGDGNMLERVTSRAHLGRDALCDELHAHATATLSRRYHHHYFGFARSQHKRALETERPTAKRILYVLRTTLSGAHLLLERECEPDLTRLYTHYGFPEVEALIEAKQHGEKHALDDATASSATACVQRAFEALNEARERSGLPEEPPQAAAVALERWMIDRRIDELQHSHITT